MSRVPEFHRCLAEALSPLSHSLAAGLLIRPVPARVRDAEEGETAPYEGEDAAAALCFDLDTLLKECVPAMKDAMAEVEGGLSESLEELVDELAAPALELVDMARRIWETPLPAEAEGARPLLATLAEAPVTQLLQWILEIMQIVIDPWAISEDPEKPDISYVLLVPDTPVREALARWRKNHPGVMPEEILR